MDFISTHLQVNPIILNLRLTMINHSPWLWSTGLHFLLSIDSTYIYIYIYIYIIYKPNFWTLVCIQLCVCVVSAMDDGNCSPGWRATVSVVQESMWWAGDLWWWVNRSSQSGFVTILYYVIIIIIYCCYIILYYSLKSFNCILTYVNYE